MNHVFVASDGTGETTERVLKAALTQFEGAGVEVERRPGIRTGEQVQQIVQEAAQADGFIIHTLVSDELRDAMVREGRLQNIETIDLMGPLLARLSQQFTVSPSEKPGLFRQLNEECFRRIETMEFAFHHDDGQRAHELSQAEIALHYLEEAFIESRYINMDELLRQMAEWLHVNGVPADELSQLQVASTGMAKFVNPVQPDITLRGEETINLGGFSFNVLWTPGHSPGHISLYEPDKKLLFSGDFIHPLPRRPLWYGGQTKAAFPS